jgi:hypothetical protein
MLFDQYNVVLIVDNSGVVDTFQINPTNIVRVIYVTRSLTLFRLRLRYPL